jgi:magnesium chelatase subunit I
MHEIQIMEQEIELPKIEGVNIVVPEFIKEILAEITFQARKSPDINQHSGVSCRVSIRSYEAITGSAIKRCLTVGEKTAVPRITDIESILPAITGKLELEYEIADSNAHEVIENLIKRSIKIVFDEHFEIKDLAPVVESFKNGMSAEISSEQPSEDYMDGYKIINGLKSAVATLVEPENNAMASSAIEFILEGLHLSNKLNREVVQKGFIYK